MRSGLKTNRTNKTRRRRIRSNLHGVSCPLDKSIAPVWAQHDEWMRAKLADGWTFGPTKDAEKKTDPALVPFSELFTAIVLALAD
jgi:RyR domain